MVACTYMYVLCICVHDVHDSVAIHKPLQHLPVCCFNAYWAQLLQCEFADVEIHVHVCNMPACTCIQ